MPLLFANACKLCQRSTLFSLSGGRSKRLPEEVVVSSDELLRSRWDWVSCLSDFTFYSSFPGSSHPCRLFKSTATPRLPPAGPSSSSLPQICQPLAWSSHDICIDDSSFHLQTRPPPGPLLLDISVCSPAPPTSSLLHADNPTSLLASLFLSFCPYSLNQRFSIYVYLQWFPPDPVHYWLCGSFLYIQLTWHFISSLSATLCTDHCLSPDERSDG